MQLCKEEPETCVNGLRVYANRSEDLHSIDSFHYVSSNCVLDLWVF
jgi:hypothetical protein